jgi:serine protease Do
MQQQCGNSQMAPERVPNSLWKPAVVAVAGIACAASLALVSPNAVLAQRAETPAITVVPGAPASFADLVAKVKPSVVSIQVVSTDGARPTRRMPNRRSAPRDGAKPFPDLPDDHPLNEFFRGAPRGEGQGATPQPRRRQGVGSGFVISADGYVVTNNHVVAGAEKIQVSFDQKEKLPARLIGTDPRTDLAVLKIESKRTFPFVKFAEKSSREGDWVVAVGNPFGLGGTVTAGIVSALSRDIGSGPYDFIQIDAAVNRGNSGGPTFNLQGEVIGVNTAIYSPSGGNVGIAFAVPARTAVEVINELKSSGTVKRGWLGVKIQSVTADMAEGLGLDGAYGALISEVTPDSPAEKAGLQSGDAITSVNGRRIEDSRDLARNVADYAPGTKVAVVVRRGDRDRTIDVNLGTFPGSTQAASPAPKEPEQAEPTALDDLGLQLKPAADGEGVVIDEVDDGTDASEKGLRKGDIITEVNSQKVSAPSDVDKQVKSAKKRGRKAVLMVIKRGSQKRFIAVQLIDKK